ncbi:DUF6817 domain-containing protein [Streptomyces sp. F001]|uniref:DUF6817 domain-containing protein n=1 Tax=Streptomyces sp. F001 TaxID=1510026 RepID=UPI00101E3D93|nr:hypothetical protein [Streptomyces sp. F001]RZB17853.1 hypothetical protein StrepF001_18785 [Streptomyces sp. F001]
MPSSHDRATALLQQLGAESVPHPGGTLLTHLDRVRIRLAGWQARPALQLAGFCHALYGTDGFPQALLPLHRRTAVAAALGSEAEGLVYLYASCDRQATYPVLPDGPFHDRFTEASRTPSLAVLRDFAELTAANELDLAAHDPEFRTRYGADLLALFTRFRPLLSGAAWDDCVAVLGGRP